MRRVFYRWMSDVTHLPVVVPRIRSSSVQTYTQVYTSLQKGAAIAPKGKTTGW